jgi:hypothetical protein
MLAKWLSNIKWALVLAIFAGPAFAYFSYTEVQAIKRVADGGVEATAIVDGGESRSGRRSGTSYTIHAIWTGEGNIERAEDLDISSEYAGRIIEDDYLLIETVVVKYLPGEPATKAIVAEDAAQQIADKELLMWLGVGAGVLGLVGSAGFFLVGRKKPEPVRSPTGA